MNKKCIALIPARGGSKRIVNKNIKLFDGKPLISYSIEAAINSGLFERVIVSTDSQEIADIAQAYGAETPFIRPQSLSDDMTHIGPVVNHALDWLEQKGEGYDYLCTIFATAPMLQIKYLEQGLISLKNSDARISLSVCSMPSPVHRSFEISKKNRLKMFWPQFFQSRSQDLPEAFYDAGQFSWTKLTAIDSKNSSVGYAEHIIPVILPRYIVQDIDTPEDWEVAEFMYQALKRSGNV